MSNIFIPPGDFNYNKSPPSDDGSTTTQNRGAFSTLLTKLGTPLIRKINALDIEADRSFRLLEERVVHFQEVTTQGDFAFRDRTSRALAIICAAGASGTDGAATVDAGDGGGGGGTAIVIFNDVQNVACTISLAATSNVYNPGVNTGSLSRITIAPAVGGTGGLVTESTGTGALQFSYLGINGTNGNDHVAEFPGNPGVGFFGAGGPGAGSHGGFINTAALTRNYENPLMWIWEIE